MIQVCSLEIFLFASGKGCFPGVKVILPEVEGLVIAGFSWGTKGFTIDDLRFWIGTVESCGGRGRARREIGDRG